MTPPTQQKVTKRLAEALKKASPTELARIMADLDQRQMEKVFEAHELTIDPKIADQIVYVRDNFVNNLSFGEWAEYRNELASLTRAYYSYRLLLADIRRFEALLVSTEHFLWTLGLMEQALWEAGYELGEEDTDEDRETSPLKTHRDLGEELSGGMDRYYRDLVRKRAEYALSSVWETEFKRPCPVDPAYSSDYTANQALLGKPILGSKELPLSREEVLTAEKEASETVAAVLSGKKARRKKAKK